MLNFYNLYIFIFYIFYFQLRPNITKGGKNESRAADRNEREDLLAITSARGTVIELY